MFSGDRYDAADATEQDRRPRYGSFRIGDGTTVVYDRDDDDAWVRSDRAVDLEERR